MVMGWAANRAYTIPQTAVLLTISTVPMAPLVATSNRPPKPIAGAKQAKNRNMVAARH